MTDQSKPELANAYRLGRLVEELASINRKKIALQLLKDEGHPIQDEKIISRAPHEIELTSLSLSTLYENNKRYLPKRLITFLKKLESQEESGLGKMNSDQLSLLHSAISGIIEESMTRGSAWHSMQAGRLSQRVWLLMNTFLDGMNDQKMPSDTLLKYLTYRSESPFINFEGGTHLWIIHQVFMNLLKVPFNPRSAESTLTRLGLHIESLPVPECLKREHEKSRMAQNRIFNDLSFLDVHEMIGDDPIDNFGNINSFFHRQQVEIGNFIVLTDSYLQSFDKYLTELQEDEFFEFQP